eukprot:CAMPEP_0172458536 /NCGR_PEP_ID=MMETSP1065-20121228/28064_1 /TAXON_ID=265537 /ORGANISM="Amphiprora paludosa, Strain CCMP125" /LENGTH=98 /DNA_ID=CAMNT_0013212847 /DNA_START=67 /DNA_END=360 /DNA_ORIENTATION=-
MAVAHCPNCDLPRTFRKNSNFLYRPFNCRGCHLDFMAPQSLVEALDSISKCSDGWAPCPNCAVLICKQGGCDHMWCPMCHKSFSWGEAESIRKRMAGK